VKKETLNFRNVMDFSLGLATKSIRIDLSVSLHIGTQELQTWHKVRMFENELARCIYAL